MSGKKILQYNKYGKYILVILISTLLSPYIHSQQPEFNFEHIRVDNGVTEPAASWIIQDSRGYLWFSCDDIIARYDGYSLISYKHELNDTLKGKNSFTVPYEDKAGILWIGTNNGLEKLDRTTGRFTHYTPNPSDTENNYSNIVLSICEDKYGVLWVGTIKGLYKFDRSTGKFTRLVSDSTDPGSIYHNEINTIYEDEQGDLWFGTGGGLDKLDYKTGKFLHYWNTPENQKKNSEIASKFCINSICEDDDGTIWLGTNWGIVEFNRNSDTFNNYLPNPGLQAAMVANSIASVNDNSIDDICLGRGNVLWFGNWNGLYGFDIKSKNFVYHYVHDVNKPGSISHNKVVSLFAEQSGTIWAGTLNGVNKFNPIKKIFKVNLPEGVFHYFMEVNGVLYIKTSKAWFRYNPITKSYFPHSFGTDKLYWIEESGSSWFRDKKGNLYKKDIKGTPYLFFYWN